MSRRREQAAGILREYARFTGLDPPSPSPDRYLWTDAFAVCTLLGLFSRTGDPAWRDLAVRLIGQVHHTLGKYRSGDKRIGWISGLDDREGEEHPAIGGLRIGKAVPERPAGEPFDETGEWERDGQYFHYLTKWMHALCQAAGSTGDERYLRWAIELAGTAHAAFTWAPASGGERMYWKMSTDLTRPLVPAMGQHDPLDGYITCHELRLATADPRQHRLISPCITGTAGICRGMKMETADPLGIGGLLADASRIAQLAIRRGSGWSGLLDEILAAALSGLEWVEQEDPFSLPPARRLAFRELGLAIGLEAAGMVERWVRENPGSFPSGRTAELLGSCRQFSPMGTVIRNSWMEETNRQGATWTAHRGINLVMLATALAPDGFLILSPPAASRAVR